jgi:hypothetical protein
LLRSRNAGQPVSLKIEKPIIKTGSIDGQVSKMDILFLISAESEARP